MDELFSLNRMSGQCLPALCVVPDVTRGRPRVSWPGPSPRPCGARAARPPGAKAPGQRPSRPWRALRTRRAGRWPLLVRVAPVLVAASRAGGGNAMRFLIPPGDGKEGFAAFRERPPPWQGPSPLPQRHAEPRPSGTGAGLSWCGLRGSCTTVVPYRAGKRGAFPCPPALPTALCRISRIIPAHSHRGCLDLNPVTGPADAPAQSGPARGLRTPPRKRQGVCGSTAAR